MPAARRRRARRWRERSPDGGGAGRARGGARGGLGPSVRDASTLTPHRGPPAGGALSSYRPARPLRSAAVREVALDPTPPAGAPAQEEAGFDGVPGPYPVGRYAGALRERLRGFAHVCLIGEVTGVSAGPGPNVYFELRDGDGAIPCAMWRTDFDRMGLAPGDLRDGAEVVVAGGCDFYPGGAAASPSFAFRV